MLFFLFWTTKGEIIIIKKKCPARAHQHQIYIFLNAKVSQNKLLHVSDITSVLGEYDRVW